MLLQSTFFLGLLRKLKEDYESLPDEERCCSSATVALSGRSHPCEAGTHFIDVSDMDVCRVTRRCRSSFAPSIASSFLVGARQVFPSPTPYPICILKRAVVASSRSCCDGCASPSRILGLRGCGHSRAGCWRHGGCALRGYADCSLPDRCGEQGTIQDVDTHWLRHLSRQARQCVGLEQAYQSQQTARRVAGLG